MGPYLKGFLHSIFLMVISEVMYQFYSKRHRKGEKKVSNRHTKPYSSALQVLFFPDKKVACRDYFVSGNGCFKDNCNFSHEKTSLSVLYTYLLSCKSSMDVCVYVFTCKDLGDILLTLHTRGVRIRIITDAGQLESTGSQIWKLRKQGIPVRVNKSSYFMHHKFVVVDNRIVVNGSFNWTHQAITGNHENLLITEEEAITSSFVSQFQKLWDEFGSMSD